MSKRRYRAIDCKQVDWSRLAEAVAGERVILSIDVAKEDFVAAWMLSDPERAVLRVKWRHPETVTGFAQRLIARTGEAQER